MTDSSRLTLELLDSWAVDPNGPVALHLRQRLISVDGEVGGPQIIYPPTYADIGYNIDRLADGTCVALIDSVGSQANRLEPIFKSGSGVLSELVPQIEIVLREEPCGQCDGCRKAKKPSVEKCDNRHKETRSLFDLAHRAADAVVQSSPTLQPKVQEAFLSMRKTGDAALLCAIAPSSLLFGCWDSRGGSGEKRPRLVRSVIRAWDVDELHAAAQFNSIWKALDEEQRSGLEKALPKGKKLSEKGFKDAPAVKYKDGRRVLGGVLVHGAIQRDVTINLVALRGLRAGDHTDCLRKYLLALAILSGTADIDLFLREGCHLRYADDADQWHVVPRRGANTPIDLVSDESRKMLVDYGREARKPFDSMWSALDWPQGSLQEGETLEAEFDLKAARDLIRSSTDEESGD